MHVCAEEVMVFPHNLPVLHCFPTGHICLQKKGGKIPDMTAAAEKDYQDQLERLKRVYGGADEDMTQFPKFQFEEK